MVYKDNDDRIRHYGKTDLITFLLMREEIIGITTNEG